MAKFNRSHLNNTFTLKILKACRLAMKNKFSVVCNRRGLPVVLVQYVNGSFNIIDKTGQNMFGALSDIDNTLPINTYMFFLVHAKGAQSKGSKEINK